MIEEIENLESIYKRHSLNNHQVIILDCTGRKSKLRDTEFGNEDSNMEIIPLESALHINFRAIFDNLDKSLLYSAMKNNENIKLSEIVSSRTVSEDGYKMVTIPIFITKNLAELFDLNYPNINKQPLTPFRAPGKEIPDEIFKVISSIIGSLLMEDWYIDFKSIEIKKIEITCGYSKTRSKSNFVCLGDSAVHLAYYKSLNFGLKHALDFFITLSNNVLISRDNILLYNDEFIIDEFQKLHSTLNPVSIKRTISANTVLVITKILYNGVYKFCLTNNQTEQMTSNFGVRESSIDNYLKQVNEELKNWNFLLNEFEQKRYKDIQEVIKSNCRKKQMFEYVSDFIWLNGKSPIKISELLSKLFYGYCLFKSDHEFFNACIKILRKFLIIETHQKNDFESSFKNLIELYSFSFGVNHVNTKNNLLNELRNVFSEEDYVKKIEKLIRCKSNTLVHDGDVKFIFIIKCLNVILEYLEDFNKDANNNH